MSQYLVLSHVDVQNANSIAGLTWGFPAITQFLGFTHALSRKLSLQHGGDYDIELTGCGVISHNTHNKVYQPKQYADFEFLQSKNPPVLAKDKSKSPPIIEEGKMNLTISLVIKIETPLIQTGDQIKELEKRIVPLCYQMRIAGGTVLNIKHACVFSSSTDVQHTEMLRKIKRLTMPGFVLLDRNDYLKQHYESLLARHHDEKNNTKTPQLLDAWLDFSALKFQATADPIEEHDNVDENTPAHWDYIPKPNTGYLVPLMTGYKSISDLYEPGAVLNIRDETTSSRFVEAIHSVGEWKSTHSIQAVDDIIWHYKYDDPWYICTQGNKKLHPGTGTELNINEALNLF